MQDIFETDLEFDWDQGNLDKNWQKHKISQKESESAFRDKSSILTSDDSHSVLEKRFQLVGESNQNKILTVIFTFRNHKIRIISARPANKKERNVYEKTKKITLNP